MMQAQEVAPRGSAAMT